MSTATLPRNATRVQVSKKHFGADGKATITRAITAAIKDAIGDPRAPVCLQILDYTEEQDVITVVDQPLVTWWAYLPWPAAGPVIGEMWDCLEAEARDAARSGLLCFDLEWHEGEPPEVGTDD